MNTKLIKQKIKSVGNIKKITRTMEMVSVAKMKKSLENAVAYRPFIANAHRVLDNVVGDNFVSHIFLSPSPLTPLQDLERGTTQKSKHDEKVIVILMAANKGLCGGYNSQVYKQATIALKHFKKENIKFITVGKYAERIAKRFNNDIMYSFEKNHISNRDVNVIVKELVKEFKDKDNRVDKVLMISPHIVSGVSYVVETLQLLPYTHGVVPFSLGEGRGVRSGTVLGRGETTSYTYEPGAEYIIETIVPLLISNIIAQAALETEAGEHAARMMAMKTATDNAGELQDDLKLTFNNARQAKITQEIAELSATA